MRALLFVGILVGSPVAHADHLGRYVRVFVDDDPRHASEGRGGQGGRVKAVIELMRTKSKVVGTYSVGPVDGTLESHELHDLELEGDKIKAFTYAVPKAAMTYYVPFAITGRFEGDHTLVLDDHTRYAK